LRKENGQTLSELCEHLDMTRQAVTKHLVLLEKANLITVVWRGREKLHYLNPMPLHEIYERWIGKYERQRQTEPRVPQLLPTFPEATMRTVKTKNRNTK